jgi:hypothetical protein
MNPKIKKSPDYLLGTWVNPSWFQMPQCNAGQKTITTHSRSRRKPLGKALKEGIIQSMKK